MVGNRIRGQRLRVVRLGLLFGGQRHDLYVANQGRVLRTGGRRNELQKIVAGRRAGIAFATGGPSNALQGGRDQRIRTHDQRRAGVNDLYVAGRIVNGVTILVHRRHVLVVDGRGATRVLGGRGRVRLRSDGRRNQMNGPHVQRSGLRLRDRSLDNRNVLDGRRMRRNRGGHRLVGDGRLRIVRLDARVQNRNWRGDILRHGRGNGGAFRSGEGWRRIRACRNELLIFRRSRLGGRTKCDRQRLIIRVQRYVRNVVDRQSSKQRMKQFFLTHFRHRLRTGQIGEHLFIRGAAGRLRFVYVVRSI